jgi:hypothetical protein
VKSKYSLKSKKRKKMATLVHQAWVTMPERTNRDKITKEFRSIMNTMHQDLLQRRKEELERVWHREFEHWKQAYRDAVTVLPYGARYPEIIEAVMIRTKTELECLEDCRDNFLPHGPKEFAAESAYELCSYTNAVASTHKRATEEYTLAHWWRLGIPSTTVRNKLELHR